jgi:hypothetical protein
MDGTPAAVDPVVKRNRLVELGQLGGCVNR